MELFRKWYASQFWSQKRLFLKWEYTTSQKQVADYVLYLLA